MAIHREKYREAILYFTHRCGNEHLGRTKLFKLLYYLDFEHAARFGTSVTGDTYRKLPHGPVGDAAFATIERLETDGLIATQIVQRRKYPQQQPIAQQMDDLSVFSATEQQVLDDVVVRWGLATSDTTMEATHRERPWQSAEMGQAIPYVREGRQTLPTPQPLSPELRESMIQYLINTQAIEGFTVPYNEAAAIVDEVYQEPLIDLG